MALTWWETPQWRAYERACGHEGQRTAELADGAWGSQVVNLLPDQEILWRGLRKSYRQAVATAEDDQDLAWDLVTGGHTRVCSTTCMPLHAEKAGRATRPPETWAMMDQWIREGNGMVSMVSRRVGDDYVPLGYVYAIIYRNWAYYASGVTITPDISHALIWRAMLSLKTRGVQWFEVGWLWRPGEDEKAKNIAFFKQGFGGVAIPAALAARLPE